MGVVFFASQAMSQRTITGKVTDDKDVPVGNVSVTVKGTKTGTVTKADGSYSLTVAATAKSLVFSSVSFETSMMVSVRCNLGKTNSAIFIQRRSPRGATGMGSR